MIPYHTKLLAKTKYDGKILIQLGGMSQCQYELLSKVIDQPLMLFVAFKHTQLNRFHNMMSKVINHIMEIK